jgi:hypothetical protein
MKNRYSMTVLLCTIYFTSFSQTSYQMETVGTPVSSCNAGSYTGWVNSGVLTFNGNAEVQNTNASNNMNASGGGNVMFTNTAGTYLQISGFNPSTVPASMDISFDMYGYNVNNLNELVLEYSTDGITYTQVPYRRLLRNYVAPTPWDLMVSDPLPGNIASTNLKIRFRQTSTTQIFQLDDIAANFYSTLPVKLISFTAAKIKSDVQLNWIGASTDEHEYFVLEKSFDGRYFSEVANVQAKGIGEFTYNYNDKAGAEKTFYRLKLVDANGRSNYSQMVFVQNVTKFELIQSIYPNPAKNSLNTQLLSSKQDNAVLQLTDLSGRLVMNKQFSLAPGINNCALALEKLKAGMYVLKISANGTIETRPIVIQ